MKKQHTKGPWKVLRSGESEQHPCGVMSESVATGMICFIPCEHEAAEANARLIASAPDLLVALDDMCKVWLSAYAAVCCTQDWTDEQREEIRLEMCRVDINAEQAISKAKDSKMTVAREPEIAPVIASDIANIASDIIEAMAGGSEHIASVHEGSESGMPVITTKDGRTFTITITEQP